MGGRDRGERRDSRDLPKEWRALETSGRDEMAEVWGGNWGCDSEFGSLHAVLLRRPGDEIEGLSDPGPIRWRELMDPGKAREQHDRLADVYRAHGAEVYYVERMRDDTPNALYMRDTVLMTPDGAIVGRQGMASRRGEERYAAEALALLGVPILRTIIGTGIFETACCLWADARTVVLGTGVRANAEGCRQVEEALKQTGVETFLYIEVPQGFAHIDSIITFVDRGVVIVDPTRVPGELRGALREHGWKVLEVPDTPEFAKELANLSLNCVALEPGRVVMAAGNGSTREFFESNGIGVEEVDVSELLKGWGSIHCMTAVLRRDPIE